MFAGISCWPILLLQVKNEIDPGEDKTERPESPPVYDTMPGFLFYPSDSPVITSPAAKSTTLKLQKFPDIFNVVGKKQELRPLSPPTVAPSQRQNIQIVETKTNINKSPRKVQKTQKLGFLNMIMVEGYQQSLPKLYPEDVEGNVRQSYGASSHATTDNEVATKARDNVLRKHKIRKKKRKMMEKMHKSMG